MLEELQKIYIDGIEIGYTTSDGIRIDVPEMLPLRYKRKVSFKMQLESFSFNPCKKCGKLHLSRVKKWEHRRAKKKQRRLLKELLRFTQKMNKAMGRAS